MLFGQDFVLTPINHHQGTHLTTI